MDTESRRIRKTALRHTSKQAPVLDSAQTTSILVDGTECTLVDIRATGDVLLDVVFENRQSASTLNVSETDTGSLRTVSVLKTSTLQTNRRVLYRVRLDTLKKTSKYFELLLSSDRFSEGKKIASTFASLQAQNIAPTEADPALLPRIFITDDDDATRISGRDLVFADLLRILHGADVATRFTIPYLAALAIMADRFDCTGPIGRYVRVSRKMPWPQTYGVMTVATEELLRQKILIAWLLGDHVRLAGATRELILKGSLRWTGEGEDRGYEAAWWDLQDGLEAELQHRRTCILDTISSIQTHFLSLYTSRQRQCKQFYDSSAACDSFQLGEMIKFFVHKNLLSLVPLSPNDPGFYPSPYTGDIETLITILRQCPSYQIDSNHVHCGLRVRIIPSLYYIEQLLTPGNIGISGNIWEKDRTGATWQVPEVEGQRRAGMDKGQGEQKGFSFTQKVLSEQRGLSEGFLGAGKLAKALFTAGSWDWSPET